MSLILALFTLVSLVDPTDKLERLGIKGPLTFEGKSFELAWTSHPKEELYIQEYLPAGEKAESFHEMLSVHLLRVDAQLHDAVMERIKALENRKMSDSVCQYEIIESPDGKEYILDFVLSEGASGKLQSVEFNIYRYRMTELAGKPAIMMYIYSKRAYGEEIAPFLESLSVRKTELLNEIISSNIPTPAN